MTNASDSGRGFVLRPRRLAVQAALALFVLVAGACTGSSGGTDGLPPMQTTEDGEPGSIPFTNPTIGSAQDLPTEWTQARGPGVGGRLTSLAYDPNDPTRLLAGGDLLGIALSTNGGGSWNSTTGLTNWEVGDIVFDPTTPGRVWAGTMGGPFLSVDGGETWEVRRDGMPAIDGDSYTAPIETVLFDPEVPGRLLAMGGSQRRWTAEHGNPLFGAVWESLDDGQSWSQVAMVAGGANIQAASVLAGSAEVVLVATAESGVQRSTNGGKSWSSANGGLPHGNATDLVSHPTDSDRAWVTLGAGPKSGDLFTPGGVFTTFNGGESWESANNGLSQFEWEDTGLTSRYEAIVISPTDPDRMYTGDISYRENFIYRSDDGGQNWVPVIGNSLELIDAFSSNVAAREMAINPIDPDSFMFAQDELLMASNDAGRSAFDLATDLTEEGDYLGRGFSGIVASDIVFNPVVSGDITLLGFDGGNFIQTVDGLRSFRRTLRGEYDWGGATRAAYAGDDGQTVYVLLGQASKFRGLGVSKDGGATFDVSIGPDAGLPERDARDKGTGLAVDPANPDVVYVVVGGRLNKSVDAGSTFQLVGDRSGLFDIAIDPETETMYFSSSDGLLVSNDGGESMVRISDSPDRQGRITLDPHRPGSVIVTTTGSQGAGIFRYDGAGWTLLHSDQAIRQVAISPEQPGLMVAVSSDLPFHDVSVATGVWASSDNGETWVQINEGLPLLRIAAAAFDPHQPDRLMIGSYGRGFYYASIAGLMGE